jgi:hypothetical protein
MKIRYYPIDNPMTTGPDDCRMQVAGYESVGEKEIFEYMTRPGSGVTPAEARGNYKEFIGAHEYFLRQGYGINTEFIKVRPTLQGTLRDQNDSFDHARHKVNFKVTLGKRYNKVSGEVKVEKVEPSNNAPLPVTFEDIRKQHVRGKSGTKADDKKQVAKIFPWVHVAIANAKRWIPANFHDIKKEYHYI